MAERFEIADVTVPSGTLSTAPQTTNLVWREGFPVHLEIRFPPGPSGQVGIRILHSGRVIIPKQAATWLIADDEIIHWPLTGFSHAPNYQVRAYNTGVYDHTIQFRWHINEIHRTGLQPVAPLSILQAVPSMGQFAEGLEG